MAFGNLLEKKQILKIYRILRIFFFQVLSENKHANIHAGKVYRLNSYVRPNKLIHFK